MFKHITDKNINIDELITAARHPEAGAVVVFSGETRNHHEGKNVRYLEYEAQVELAEKTIESILQESLERWPLKKALAVHRIGRVDISESAIVVVTSSAHRKDAYEASMFIMDAIKQNAPIWKKEFFSEGDAVWR